MKCTTPAVTGRALRPPGARRPTGRPDGPASSRASVPSGSSRSTEIRISSPPYACQAWHQDLLGLDGHGVNHQPTADRKQVASIGRAGPASAPPPTKIASGCGSPSSAADHVGGDHLEPRYAEPRRVGGDPGGPVGVLLDRDGAAARVGPAPLDGDGAGTRTEVPEQLPGHRCEPGQGGGPQVPFGQLAVVVVRIVGQPGHDRRARPSPDPARQSTATTFRAGRIGQLARVDGDRLQPALTVGAQVAQHRQQRSVRSPRRLSSSASATGVSAPDDSTISFWPGAR